MRQETQATVNLTYDAQATLSGAQLRHAINADLSRLLENSDDAPVALTGLSVGDVREEAAIYGTDAPAAGGHEAVQDLAKGVRDLYASVQALTALYERHPALNELQPASLAACYLANLDDWADQLAAALGDVGALATFYGKLSDLGFASEFAGGGCYVLSTYRNGAAVWLTCEGGAGYPTPDSWMVGVYAPPGPDGAMPDALWLIQNEPGEEGTGRFFATVAAALATAEAIGEADEESGPDEYADPCPVNRCPKDRCPDGCDHGERA